MITENENTMCFLVIRQNVKSTSRVPMKAFQSLADATAYAKAHNKDDKNYYYTVQPIEMKYLDKDEIE
jgi:hypothetical protein